MDHLWYFAYGSNMSVDVFTKRRKIAPISYAAAQIETLSLCFNVMGVPYVDPGMGGLRAIDNTQGGLSSAPVIGVAYELTPEDMNRVIISEG